jgi:hypothetical protein
VERCSGNGGGNGTNYSWVESKQQREQTRFEREKRVREGSVPGRARGIGAGDKLEKTETTRWKTREKIKIETKKRGEG